MSREPPGRIPPAKVGTSSPSPIGSALGGVALEEPKRPLRIGVIAPPWYEVPPTGYGGIESMCYWLVEGLRARGHHVVLVAAGPNRISGSFIQTYPTPPSGRLGQSLPELVHAAQATHALGSMRLEVVHDHSAAGPLTAGGRRIPTVVTAHGLVTGELGQYYRALGDRISLVSISHAQRRTAPDLRWAGTVHNAIPVVEYPYRVSKDPFLLFLGRMSPDKGPHLAIEAARATKRPLILAGKCSEPGERAFFDSEIRPRLSRGVRYLGEVNESTKKELLSRARCLVFPIRWEEPFGMVMVEAMACGTPVVALRGGSVEEIVSDGATGFVLDEPSDLPSAIEGAGGVDARACRDRVLQCFDVKTMVRGYEHAYLLAIEQSKTADEISPSLPVSGLRQTGSGAPV